MRKKDLIWLECCGCSGNFISFLNSDSPPIEILTEKYINLTFSNSEMSSFGSSAMEVFFNTIANGNYILVVEGAIATAKDGLYNVIGYYNNRPITGLEAVKAASSNTNLIVATGNCASYGSVSAAPPNLSASLPLSSVLNKGVIKMPGCPCSGNWIASLLLELSLGNIPELDSDNRPLYLYGLTVHDKCSQRSFFQKNIFANKVGEEGCYLKIGCKGPVTKAPCPVTRWNNYINWPIGCNTPCIGCANKEFPNYTFIKDFVD